MKLTTRQGKAYVKLDGDLTVAKALELKNVLVDSLAKADEIIINLEDISSIDLACLQLLCSAHLSATKKGKTLTVKDPAPSIYIDARKASGFMFNKPCRHAATEDCLWIGGSSQ